MLGQEVAPPSLRRALGEVREADHQAPLREAIAQELDGKKGKSTPISWSSLRQKLSQKGFVTRPEKDSNGKRKTQGGKPLAKSAIERFLRDLDRKM